MPAAGGVVAGARMRPWQGRRWAWGVALLGLLGALAMSPPSHAQPDTAAPAAAASAAAPATPALPAGYVSDERCLICHALEGEHWAHTVHAKVFGINPRNDLERRGCQTCHGPGERHAQDPTDKRAMVNFTHKGGTPVAQQNAQCLQCHQGRQRIFWGGSAHQRADVSCSDCHNPMARFGDNALLRKTSVSETCFTCHQQQRTEFMKRSHMPLPEGKMSCSDCHNPHGTPTRPLLKADSVNQLCYGCHQEKRGPFLYEHAPVRQNCMNCHQAHGSSNDALLAVARPFLCQQCHAQILHPNDLMTRANAPGGGAMDPRGMNRSCSNCHAQIHGSNHPAGVRFHR